MLTFLKFISGALIEYAVILFKKQKLSKFGAPGQSAYPHQGTQLPNYMSIRRPNRDSNPNGMSSHSTAQVRQGTQRHDGDSHQQQQYDMRPITSCRYDWNQGLCMNK